MKRIAALLALALTFSGCATCREHKATCAIVTGFVAGTIYIAAQGTNHPPSAHDIQTPRVNCTGSSCQ